MRRALAQSQTTPDALDIGCSYGGPASGALCAAADLSGLFDALDQLGKQFVIHSGGLCVRLSFRCSVRWCLGVRPGLVFPFVTFVGFC